MKTGITTEALALQIGIKSGSLRSEVCRSGSYFGLRPERLPNRRLLWPSDSVERLLAAANTNAFRVGGFTDPIAAGGEAKRPSVGRRRRT